MQFVQLKVTLSQGAISLKCPRTDVLCRYDDWPMVDLYTLPRYNKYT